MRQRLTRWALVAVLSAVYPTMSAAQGFEAGGLSVGQVISPILTIDEERLFFGSAFGRRVSSELGAAQRALEARDAEISKELREEEDALTEARPTMDAEEFRKLADAFDAKVVQLRGEIEEASRSLTQRLEEERQTFRRAIAPLLAQIVQERGAVAILDKRQVFASIDQIDITNLAIARADQVLGDGTGVRDVSPGAPGRAPDE